MAANLTPRLILTCSNATDDILNINVSDQLTVTDPSNGSLVVTANFHNHRTDNESESGPTQNTSGITYSDLEGMTVRLLKSGTDRAIITYVYVVVNYTATATVADNATFFGTNF